MSARKEVADLRRQAESQGWTVVMRKAGHLCWTPPGGKGKVFTPSTPSDRRSILNMRAELRRHGLDVPRTVR